MASDSLCQSIYPLGVYPNAVLSGHPTVEGVTSTGATGTGKFVFDTAPTLATPVIGVATGTSLGLAGALTTTTADNTTGLLVKGATNLLRVQPQAAGMAVEGTTANQGAYAPLFLDGSTVTLQTNGVTAAISIDAAQKSSFSGIMLNSSGRVRSTRVVIASGAVTVATTDDIIIVNKTSGAATAVNLMATPATGTYLVVKDGKGDATANNITLTPAAGTIDGAATALINTNFGVAHLVYNGTQWNIVGENGANIL